VCLERSLISFVSTIEELLERKKYRSGLEIREYSRATLDPQKLVVTSPTSGCLSVGIDRSRTQDTEFVFFFFLFLEMYS
jgi:hypothetical protein